MNFQAKRSTLIALLAALAFLADRPRGIAAPTVSPGSSVEVTVTEGTSMSVGVSPDGKTLAIDLQGSIYTLPVTGGPAKRLTDIFSDARQPVWSPDGKWIAYFAFADGGYDLWAIAPDGTGNHKLTTGAFDDREPAWSHDGKRIAFASDRGDTADGSYNIWVLDIVTGAITRVTSDASENHMPAWSPDDKEIAFSSTRDGGNGVWVASVADGRTRRVATAEGTASAPSWSPSGKLVYHAAAGNVARLEADGKALTGDENAFPFRVSWVSGSDFYYVSDGKIRHRALGDATAKTIPFTATLTVTQPRYTRRKRDFDSTAPRPALGIVRPVLSPDATKVVFAAVGDIWLMPVGGKPENLTKDEALDTDPAWSPDGSQIVYSSDKGGGLLQLWVRDIKSGQARQLTHLSTQPMGATWSPDGKKIAVFDVDAMWRAASLSLVDAKTGEVTKIHASLFGPGIPTWSPDSSRVALAMVSPYSKSFREGTNQILTVSAKGGDDKWFVPEPNLSIDSRGGCGPVWSPDGTKMAAIYEGQLAVWPVSSTGEPLGPPRHITSEIAHAPSWAGDSEHILYQSMDKLKIVSVLTGATKNVPLDLTWTPAIPKGRLLVHAGSLVDGKSETARSEVDILIENNRIRSVQPHSPKLHSGVTVVDGSKLTAMPGLMDFHSHLQKDFGANDGRAWLALGVTTVRSPGSTPYEAVEDREANEAGVRPGPRVFGTGYLMEWQRVYYKMGIAISGPAHFEMELERARILQHDLLKSYVRLPDLQQRRMVEFGHGIGVPVATHEIYPASFVGVDNTEHLGATSRRGYSPKQATLQRTYDDVIQLFGKSQRWLTPTMALGGMQVILQARPDLRTDPRFELYPEWLKAQVTNPGGRGGRGGRGGGDGTGPNNMLMETMKAGAKIVAGTDSPNALSIHGELLSYVKAGMTPWQALRTATVNTAEALNLDAGTIEPGKLADIVLVDGNPLMDINNALNVKRVIANGRLYEMKDLLRK